MEGSTVSEILVVGSANMDRVLRVPGMPVVGETMRAVAMTKSAGGKGVNQAVAAARLGATVRFCGAVGDDSDGRQLLRVLQAEGVGCADVTIVAGASSGTAIVIVDQGSGQNSIVTVEGANGLLPKRQALRFLESAKTGSVLVLQAEISADTVDAAITYAAQRGLRVVLNLAPYRAISEAVLGSVDVLIVNEAECSSLCGFAVSSVEDAERAALSLAEVCRSVIVTLGESGAVWARGNDYSRVSAPYLENVVDTAGAGDAFVGAVAVALSRSKQVFEATREGILAGSFAVQSEGTVPSYPTSGELLGFAVSSA